MCARELKLSVIMPVYNARTYLHRAIESVYHQLDPDMELIIVDDGSTDGSAEVCAHWASVDSRIQLINQQNRGISAARNQGVAASSGRFLYFMDHDDELHDGAIRLAMNVLTSTSADVVKFGVQYTTMTTEANPRTHLLSPPLGVLSRTEMSAAYGGLRRQGVFTFVWNAVYTRSLVQQMGPEPFDPRYTVGGEDLDFNLRAFRVVQRCALLPDVLYTHWRRKGQSTVERPDPRAVDNSKYLATLELDLVRDLDADRRVLAEIAVTHCVTVSLAKWRSSKAPIEDVMETGASMLHMYGAPRSVAEWAGLLLALPRFTVFSLSVSLGWSSLAAHLLRLNDRA